MKKYVTAILCALGLLAAWAGTGCAAAYSMVVEGEVCSSYNLGDGTGCMTYELDDLSGRKAAAIDTKEGIPAEGYYLKYNVVAPVAGYYDMELMSSKQGRTAGSTVGYQYTSPFTIQINGSGDLRLHPNARNWAVTSGSSSYQSFFATYYQKIYLEKGENEIAFYVREPVAATSSTYAGRTLFYLDYFKLEYAVSQEIQYDASVFAGVSPEGCAGYYPQNNTQYERLYGGKSLQTSGTAGPVRVQMDVYVPAAGQYALETVCGEAQRPWTANWRVCNDEGETVGIDGNVTQLEQITSGTWDPGLFYKYRTNTKISLEQGWNKVYIEVPEPRGTDDKQFMANIDYIAFVKAESQAADGFIIEGESAYGTNEYWQLGEENGIGTILGNYSGRDALCITQQQDVFGDMMITNEMAVEYPFTVERAGRYDVTFQMSAPGGTEWVSPVEIKFDDGAWIQLSAENCRLAGQLGSIAEDAAYGQVYNYVSPVAFTEGGHTMMLRVRKTRGAGGMYVCFFDCAKFTEHSDAVLGLDALRLWADGVLTAGGTARVLAEASNTAGGLIDETEYTLSFTAANPQILHIDAQTGEMTGVTPGTTTVYAVCESGGVQVEQALEVSVFAAGCGVYPYAVQKMGNIVQLKVAKVAALERDVTLIGIAYGTEADGLPTSIRELQQMKLTDGSLNGALAADIQLQFKADLANSMVAVYVWDSIEGMFPAVEQPGNGVTALEKEEFVHEISEKAMAAFLAGALVFTGAQAPLAAEELKVEGENYTSINFSPKGYPDASGLSGNKFIALQQQFETGKTYKLIYDVAAEQEGVYTMTAVTTPPGTGWSAAYSIQVNGGELMPVTDPAKIRDISASNVSPGTLAEYNLGAVKLNKGKNKVAFVVSAPNQGSGNVTLLLDYFAFSQAQWGVRDIVPTGPVGTYREGQSITMDVRLTGAPEDHALQFEVTDFWKRTVRSGTFTVEKNEISHRLNLGRMDAGWYYIRVYDGAEQAAESAFAVVPQEAVTTADTPFAVDFAGHWHAPENRWEAFGKAMAMAGVGWVRERMNWSQIQPEDGKWDYSRFDRLTGALSDAGENVMMVYHDAPAWALGEDGKMPRDLFMMYDAAKEMAEHAKGDVAAWEIWNEEDTRAFADETADTFASVFKAAALGANASTVDPFVVFGGFSFNAASEPFIDLVFQNGIMDYTDAYNLHHHVDATGEPVNEVRFESIYKEHPRTDRAYNADSKPMWVSEDGFKAPVAPGERSASFEGQQEKAKYLATSMAEAVSLGLDKMFWFLFTHYMEGDGDFGTFYENGTPYPAYQALAVITRALGTADYKGKLLCNNENIRGHVFNNGKEDVAVLWAETPATVSLASAGRVKVTDIMGGVRYIDPIDGVVALPVDEYPIYAAFAEGVSEAEYEKVIYENREIKNSSFTDVQKIVMMQDFTEVTTQLEAKMSGYPVNKDGGTEMKLDVYNFNDKAMEGTVSTLCEGNVVVSPAEQAVTIEPMSKTTLTFHLQPDENEELYSIYDLRFDAVFGGEQASPSVSHIKISQTEIEPGGIFAANDDFSQVDITNVAPGAKVNMTKGPEPHSVTYQVNYANNDHWFYPKIKVADIPEFQNAAGITFSMYSDIAKKDNFHDFATVFVYTKDGNQYMLGHGAIKIKEGWQQFQFTWDQWQGITGLTPDQIEYISVGFNCSSKESFPLTFKNIGWFYTQEGGAAKGYHDLQITISGAERDAYVGKDTVLTAALPEEIVPGSVRVMANNFAYDAGTEQDGVFRLPLSGLESGYYIITIVGYTDTGYAVDADISLHVQ